METTPEVSIVVPIYNEGKSLSRALGSILMQTFTNYEVILVDDGSEEDYSRIIAEFGLKNLSYFKLPHRNANVARNYGIGQSKGNYIAMLDADDEWLPHHLESNISIINNCDCDGIYGSVMSKGIKGERIFQVRSLHAGEKMVNYLLSASLGAQTSTLFVKAYAARKVLWDESLCRHQDYDFVIRFDKQFKWIANMNVTAVYHSMNKPARVIDFESCIRFIDGHKNEILPEVYKAYHKQMLRYAIGLRSETSIIEHYIRNSF